MNSACHSGEQRGRLNCVFTVPSSVAVCTPNVSCVWYYDRLRHCYVIADSMFTTSSNNSTLFSLVYLSIDPGIAAP